MEISLLIKTEIIGIIIQYLWVIREIQPLNQRRVYYFDREKSCFPYKSNDDVN
jgi:hypothetical protein